MLGFNNPLEGEIKLRHRQEVRDALSRARKGQLTEEEVELSAFDHEKANVVLY